jgi:predicted nucleic-acid-binding protein
MGCCVHRAFNEPALALEFLVDTNILVMHLTNEPMNLARPATACSATESEILLADLVLAESVYVLESYFEASREAIASSMRSLLAMKSIICVDVSLLLRPIEVNEVERIEFAEAYLVACAESTVLDQ